jgi:hypothetical protein
MTAARDHTDSGVAAALRYASQGWPVFPCVSGEKLPATRHGFLDATTDAETITRWWTVNAARNVAIATGAAGPDVLDVDQQGEHGSGFGAFNRLKRHGHIASRHLDYRAQGGYVLAPPSTVGGRAYEVISHQATSAALEWAAVKELLAPAEAHRAGWAGRMADTAAACRGRLDRSPDRWLRSWSPWRRSAMTPAPAGSERSREVRLNEADLERARQLAANAPPLSPEAREQLRAILAGCLPAPARRPTAAPPQPDQGGGVAAA